MEDNDWHLSASCPALIVDGGIILGGYTTDIDGETRSAWGIGADER